MRHAILAILTLLPSCSDGRRAARSVDIDGAAVEAQADIDHYAAQRAADERRRGGRGSARH